MLQAVFTTPAHSAGKLTLGICACLLSVTTAMAGTADVLALCLDTDLRPEDRAERLLSKGWHLEGTPEQALATALTLTRMKASDPEGWQEVQEASAQTALTMIGDDVFLSTTDGQEAVFFGRDRTGLQTCLYLGSDPDLSALVAALDGSIVRTIGEVSRIRGDGVKSLISAHAISDHGRAVFDPALPFTLTFTVVLDRQPGDGP